MQYANEWACLCSNKIYFPKRQQADCGPQAIICQPLLSVIGDIAFKNTSKLSGLLQKPPNWYWSFFICTTAFCSHQSNQEFGPMSSHLTNIKAEVLTVMYKALSVPSHLLSELISYWSSLLSVPSSHTGLGLLLEHVRQVSDSVALPGILFCWRYHS